MSDSASPTHEQAGTPGREEMMAALFANMVIQQTNMAMMLMGRVAHPQTGEFMQDLEAARMFIDQLEMLEVKTKGNLSKQEDALLKQALTSLRMGFVESVEHPGVGAGDQHAGGEAPTAAALEEAPASESAVPEAAPATPKTSEPPKNEAQEAPDESRKKFSKKY